MNIERQKNFLIRFAFWGVISCGGFLLLRFCLDYLFPFFAAFLIASLLDRPIRSLARTLGGRRTPAAIFTVAMFYLVLFFLLALAGVRTAVFLRDLFLDLPRLYYSAVEPAVSDAFQRLEEQLLRMDPAVMAVLGDLSENLLGSMGEFVSGISMAALGGVSSFAATLPGFFVNFLIAIIVTFFLSVDYPAVTGFLSRQVPQKALRVWEGARTYVGGTLVRCIASYAVICGVTFCELFVGLTILRVPRAFFLALLIAIFDVLPVLGTGGIVIPWAAVSAVCGNLGLGVGLLILYLVITVVRQVLEPKIVGSQVGLHPVITLASMILGLRLFGVVGLFGLPILLSLLKNMNDKGVIRLFR